MERGKRSKCIATLHPAFADKSEGGEAPGWDSNSEASCRNVFFLIPTHMSPVGAMCSPCDGSPKSLRKLRVGSMCCALAKCTADFKDAARTAKIGSAAMGRRVQWAIMNS